MNPEIPSIALFLCNLEKQFEGMNTGALSAETEFKQLPEWSSIQSLIILGSFNWDYGINLPAEELRKAKTLRDLYQALFKIAF